MLLAVDIGNTNIKFGVYDGPGLISKFSLATHSHIASDLTAGHNDAIDAAIVCSVVPDLNEPLANVLKSHLGIQPRVVTNRDDLGMRVLHTPVDTLGTDRLVNSFSAAEKYGTPCISCSLGTASTFDPVDGDRVLLGGVIAPGMKTVARALNQNTAQLPEVEIELPVNVIAQNTRDAIRSGIVYGQIDAAAGIINRMKREIGGEVRVIATGGFAAFIAGNTDVIDVVDDNLLLDGLRLIHERSHPA
jgi:type III pantothenate kinase